MDADEAKALREQIAALTATLNTTIAALAARAGDPAPVPTISIRALYDAFKRVRSGQSGWKDIEDRLAPLLRLLGDLPAMQLDPFRWAEHMTVRAGEDTRFGRPPSPKTLAIELVRANQLMSFGVKHKLLPANPLEAVERPRVISERETWLDDDGIGKLLDGVDLIEEEHARGLLRAFVLLCCDSMLRFEEARHLRRSQIRNGVVTLSAKSTKSKRKRMVGLTPRTVAAIEAIPPVVGDDRLFLNAASGKLWGQSSLRRWFREAVILSGVDGLAVPGERVVVHTLRHSGASIADERGAPATAIQDGLGHSSLATTERYLHRHKQAGAIALADIMSRARKG